MSDINEEEGPDVNYRAPEKKSMEEILNADKGDESLEKYKATLLGATPTTIIVDPHDQRRVILRSISLVVDGRPDVVMQLTHAGALADACFQLKEGTHYRLKFDFHVQREIVTGLKYKHKVTKMGIPVLKETLMVGSYAPKSETQSYISPAEEAPSGMMHRGKYKVKSQLTDDDSHDWLTWTWSIEISKEW